MQRYFDRLYWAAYPLCPMITPVSQSWSLLYIRSGWELEFVFLEARDSIEILWYLIPVRCTIELTEKEQWGSYPLFLKKGMPVHGRGLDISMPELK